MAQPVKNKEYDFPMELDSVLDVGFQIDPTLAIGDFQVMIDYKPYTNIAVPTIPESDKPTIKVVLTAEQFNGSKIKIRAKDQTTPIEWNEATVFFDLADSSIETIGDIIEGDIQESSAQVIIKKKGTATIVLQKDIAGSLLSPSVTVNTSEP